MDDELETGFPEELQEALTDVIRECWRRMGDVDPRALRFFHTYAESTLHAVVGPDDTKEGQLSTAFFFMFMAGREHALRGFRTPIPKEDMPDEMPLELEDDIERMYGPNHE